VKRIRRHLFTICAVFSLLLCLSTCVVWARSFWLTDRVGWSNQRGSRVLQSARGRVMVQMLLADWSNYPSQFHGLQYQRDLPSGAFNWLRFLSPEQGMTWREWEAGGFAWYECRNRATGNGHLIAVVPFWFIAATTALPPALWILLSWRARFRDKQRMDLGLCLTCGYDLRASSERCPECGSVRAV